MALPYREKEGCWRREHVHAGDVPAEQTLPPSLNPKVAVQFWPPFLSQNPHPHLSTPTEAAHEGSHLG